MTKADLERRLEAVEKQNLGFLDEIKNLKAQLAYMRDEPEIPDKPVFDANERYWRMYPTLEHIRDSVFHSDYNGECYNLFHTKEYADEFADKCKLIAMMLHCKWYLCTDYAPDFTDTNSEKWYVFYNTHIKSYDYISSTSFDRNTVYFDTAENAKKCADWLNKHWKENDNER